VAHTIMGIEPPEIYAAAPPYFWTDQPGLKVQLLGWPALADRNGWLEDGELTPKTVYGWWRGDTLVAVALLGQPRLMVRYRKELMARQFAAEVAAEQPSKPSSTPRRVPA
jgi:hypothetical protein